MTDLRKAAEMALEALEELRFANAPFLDKAMEALRQALSQTEQECIYPECETSIGCDGPCGEKPVDETAKHGHEPVVGTKTWIEDGRVFTQNLYASDIYITPPPKREWVGYTNEDRERIVPVLVQSLLNHDDKTMAVLLKAILIDIETQLKEKNGG